jgi:hypothetical protein
MTLCLNTSSSDSSARRVNENVAEEDIFKHKVIAVTLREATLYLL